MSEEKEHNPWWMDAKDRAHLSHFSRHPSKRERAREQVMRQWYGAEASAVIGARRSPPRHIGQTVDQVIKELGMSRNVLMESLLLHWPEIVGKDMASRAVPSEIKGTCLVIEVANAAWLYALRTIHKTMISDKVAVFSQSKLTDVQFVPQGKIRRQ
ncbi:MAG: DciA family protein [Lentisphaeria bacterium]|nr:DciA family protein [Lentisphaeria bacterium]